MRENFGIWRTFAATPHRMFFFGGIVQSVLIMAWWLADLAGRYGSLYTPIAWSVSPLDVHAFLMLYAFSPYLIFGFLMTTYPRWMNGDEVERRHYIPAFLLLTAGTLLFYVALLSATLLLLLAALLFLTGWGIALAALLRVYIRAQHPDKRHARITSIVLTLGWILAACWFVGVLCGLAFPLAMAKSSGVWLFLFPVFFAVSHRMIPFFSSNVIPNYCIVRPGWALLLVPLGGLLHVTLELSGLSAWLWLVDFPMAVAAFYLTMSWGLRASLGTPLLAMLHIGFAWLGVALLLYATQSLALLAGYIILGKAPLHALTIGYFTSMMLGMATRVTLGHSGRTLTADKLTWAIFLIFQTVPILRIVADVPGIEFMLRGQLYQCAALIWLACLCIWAYHYAPIYWKPRSDGHPG